jgi:hypothetical protein
MADQYPILQLQSDSPDVIEQLGSKEKFWFRMPGDEQPWLFKFTRENTGEDWSEKLASEVAHLLGVPAARVELAIFMTRRGCASRSFVETKKGFDLIHGSELLTGRVLGYDRAKQRHQSDHCIPNILSAIEQTFPPKQRAIQLRTLAGFIVLDAIICNTDRHHDNWALIRGPFGTGKIVHQVAPSFDHASSLGRELRDEKRRQMVAQKLIGRYVAKGSGGIYWQKADAKGANPLDLAIQAANKYPDFFRPWLEQVRELNVSRLEELVARVPADWMSLESKEFCTRLMSATIDRLKAVQL